MRVVYVHGLSGGEHDAGAEWAREAPGEADVDHHRRDGVNRRHHGDLGDSFHQVGSVCAVG